MKVRLIAGIPETRNQGWQTKETGDLYTGKILTVVEFHKVVGEAIRLEREKGKTNFFHIGDIKRVSKSVKKPGAKIFDPSELI
jgi:hypothetical protein